ncbi:hypothetical protein Y032_0841g2627 [Ancylostoma ceylanicum]|uniref:Uncharacterized protein n=1 Tax=Ancylostoma ceylanicum TaxID=53326 RepID=A0A016WAT3_9BILA|nr:hypothetical protein Y032_0841g2627 [Ancylostoma ceylanicum]
MSYATGFPGSSVPDSPPPPYVISIRESPKRIHARSLKSNELKLEWIPYTTTHAALYIFIAIIVLVYNSICFVHNFGRMPLAKTTLDEVIGEEPLLCSVVMQWMMVFSIFAAGIALERCVPQPLHLFLSILATNGNTVLFAINVRKVTDGVIGASSEYFIFVTLLFLLSTVLCCAYLVALNYYRKQKRLHRSTVLSSTAHEVSKRRMQRAEEYKDASGGSFLPDYSEIICEYLRSAGRELMAGRPGRPWYPSGQPGQKGGFSRLHNCSHAKMTS